MSILTNAKLPKTIHCANNKSRKMYVENHLFLYTLANFVALNNSHSKTYTAHIAQLYGPYNCAIWAI